MNVQPTCDRGDAHQTIEVREGLVALDEDACERREAGQTVEVQQGAVGVDVEAPTDRGEA